MGPFALFRGGDTVEYETLHLVVGGLLCNAVLLPLLLVPFTRLRHRWVMFTISLDQYGLTHLQLRLGLGSNEDATPLAYHIPGGVLVFCLAYLTAAMRFDLRFERGESAKAGP